MDSYFPLTNLVAAAICFLALLSTAFFYRKSRSCQENKTMASSSLTLSPQNWKHHVFPSFHGADVRNKFLSHVLKELRSKAINLFIDNDIERSKSIGPELIEAIKGSRIAIVLLSKNYASSTWCLNELAEIIKCREGFGQTVMPLFYELDPTDVKKQTGDFGKVFKKTCKGKTKDEIRRWQHALTEVAQVAGYHSTNRETEAEMITAIATEVSNKLNLSAPCSDFDGLVGMESHMTQLEPLLQLDSSKVRKIGIWGPPGIGKTTIARCLFNRHSQDFQLSVFLDNIKRKYEIPACSDDYSVKLYLQKQLMSQLTNDTCVSISHLGVIQDRLQDKKVLDDVDHLKQVEAMAKETYWFGPGSRIIITTQDQRILRASGVKLIHRVYLPSDDEALQMFCMYAFGQKDPKDGFKEVACEVRNLVGKLPLGLKVMGSFFRGMPEEYWIEALPRLKTHIDRDGEIEGVLKFSYDALNDEDKSLFLHIACFFNNEPVDIVGGCLVKCFLDVTQGLHVLLEKSLIDIDSHADIKMAELLVQLGRKIVRKEYASEPGKRKFFDARVDIGEVNSDDKTGDLDEDIIGTTSERAFENWSNLQFLRVFHHEVNPRSMNYMSQKLRVLTWWSFKMICFPSTFNPEFLVKLDMQWSELEKLWEGTQPLRNLKWMDLSYSSQLKELPDLSTATSLNELNLKCCQSLVELPYSIGNAINLQKLDFSGCSSLVELPFSIGNMVNLEELVLSDCSSLVELPSSIGNATNLENLYLDSCSSLVEFPSSIGNIVNLERLHLSHCSSLMELPSSMRNLGRLWELKLEKCSKLEVNLVNINFESLGEVNLSDCSSFKSYHESFTDIQEIDPWIGRISYLHSLILRGMQNLVSLPQLPDSLSYLDASHCGSLERLDCCYRNPYIRLYFINCYKLNQEAKDLIIQSNSKFAVFPAEEVPLCVTYRSSGSSVTVKLNRLPVGKSTKFKVGVICVNDEVVIGDISDICWDETSVHCAITSGRNSSIDFIKKVDPPFQGHLFTFEVEVETEEVTSTELVFDFDVTSNGAHRDDGGSYCWRTWDIKECGIIELLEAPLLSFRDGDEDFEPSDTESFADDNEDFEPNLFTTFSFSI